MAVSSVIRAEFAYSGRICEELDSTIAAIWDELYASKSNPCFSQSREWFECLLVEAEIEVRDYFFVLIEQGDEPVALFGIYRDIEPRFGVSLRTLNLCWPNDMHRRNAPIRDDSDGPEIFRVLTELLETEVAAWDLIRFDDVAAGSDVAQVLLDSDSGDLIRSDKHAARVPIAASPEDSLVFLSARSCRRIRKKRRLFEENGPLLCEITSSSGEYAAALDTFLQVEASGWKGVNGKRSALLYDEPQRKFYERLFSADGRQLDRYVATLRQREQVLAVNLMIRSGNTVSILKTAYDETFARYSPGSQLIVMTLEFLSREAKASYLSFTTGPTWTDRWRPERIALLSGLYFGWSLRGSIAKQVARSRMSLDQLISEPRMQSQGADGP